MIDIPQELKNAIYNDELLVFVGAGLSFNLLNINKAPLKSWGNLVKQILIHLENKGYEVNSLTPLLKKYSPIKVLDLIESDNDIPKKEIYQFIKEFLDLDITNDFKLHKKIFRLSNKIITTNYDTAFEIAIPELKKNKAYKGRNYELTTHKDSHTSLLFKLHGCFEEADSMVLFPTNYNNLYNNSDKESEHSLLVLRNIIINKSILFIGTGMGDHQINTIFKEVKRSQGDYNQKHFIITNKNLNSSLDFLTPLNIENHSEIELVIDNLIELKEECKSAETEEVTKLKEQLIEAEQRIKKLEAEIKPNNNQLLEREALKYLFRGVEYSLSNEPYRAIKEYKTAIELKPDLDEAYYNWANDLCLLAKKEEDEDAKKLYNDAFEKYKKAIEIKPDNHEAFYNWGNNLGYLAKTKEGEEAEKIYNQAIEKYRKATEIKPDNYKAYNNWGINLGHIAETKENEEAEKLFNQAFEKFKKATDIKQDHLKAFYNWGNNFANFAKIKKDEEAKILYSQALEQYKKAINIKPDYYSFLNWGTYLGDLAKMEKGKDAEKLYNDAFEKFKKANTLKPDSYDVFNNWGVNLGEFAQLKEGKEAEKLFNQAFEKFKKAITIKPSSHNAYNNWGTSLGYFAKTKQGEEAKSLYKLSLEKLEKGIEFGSSTYNLSCIYALKKDKKNALHYLDNALSEERIKICFIEKDDDWQEYLTDNDFIELLKKYKNGNY